MWSVDAKIYDTRFTSLPVNFDQFSLSIPATDAIVETHAKSMDDESAENFTQVEVHDDIISEEMSIWGDDYEHVIEVQEGAEICTQLAVQSTADVDYDDQ